MPGDKYQYNIFLEREEGYWDNFGYDAAGLSWPLPQFCGEITDPHLSPLGKM